jgi:membrane protease YdiL (CAAX protease family)
VPPSFAGPVAAQAGLTASAVLYGEVRVRTGSIWPGVVLHSVTNAIATPPLVNGHLGFSGHADALFSPIAGSILVMLLCGAAGRLLVSSRPVHRPEPARAPLPDGDPAAVR